MAKDKIYIFDEKEKTFTKEDVKNTLGDEIETKYGIYPKENAKLFIDEDTQSITYVLNMDLPSKVEAQTLKKLRRSQALNNLFNYQTKKPLDVMAMFPYLIILAMILFM